MFRLSTHTQITHTHTHVHADLWLKKQKSGLLRESNGEVTWERVEGGKGRGKLHVCVLISKTETIFLKCLGRGKWYWAIWPWWIVIRDTRQCEPLIVSDLCRPSRVCKAVFRSDSHFAVVVTLTGPRVPLGKVGQAFESELGSIYQWL